MNNFLYNLSKRVTPYGPLIILPTGRVAIIDKIDNGYIDYHTGTMSSAFNIKRKINIKYFYGRNLAQRWEKELIIGELSKLANCYLNTDRVSLETFKQNCLYIRSVLLASYRKLIDLKLRGE